MDKQFLLTTRIIFGGVFMGPIIFIVVVLSMQSAIDRPFSLENDPFMYAVIGAATAAVVGSTMFYRLRLPAAKAQPDTTTKFAEWRKLFIIKLAIVEAAIMFSVVALLVQEADIYLYVAAGLTAVQAMNFPLETSIQNELDIS